MSADRTHGGLVESTLEAVQTWLRLAAASVEAVALAKERGRPLVEAELHDDAAYRYEDAAQKAGFRRGTTCRWPEPAGATQLPPATCDNQ